MKQNRAEHIVLLSRLLDGRHDAWGTDLGARVFGSLNLELMSLGEGTLVPIDYAQIERTDVSFQREAVVETLRKHRPRLLFIIVNLDDVDIMTNLEHALERRGECVIVRQASGLHVMGRKLSEEQRATLERVWELGETTSSQLVREAEDRGEGTEKLSTASSRLTSLWKAGMLERVEGTASSGGREHRYYPIC